MSSLPSVEIINANFGGIMVYAFRRCGSLIIVLRRFCAIITWQLSCLVLVSVGIHDSAFFCRNCSPCRGVRFSTVPVDTDICGQNAYTLCGDAQGGAVTYGEVRYHADILNAFWTGTVPCAIRMCPKLCVP